MAPTLEQVVKDFEGNISKTAGIQQGEDLAAESLEILERFKYENQINSPLYDRFNKLRGKLNERLAGMYNAAEELKKT